MKYFCKKLNLHKQPPEVFRKEGVLKTAIFIEQSGGCFLTLDIWQGSKYTLVSHQLNLESTHVACPEKYSNACELLFGCRFWFCYFRISIRFMYNQIKNLTTQFLMLKIDWNVYTIKITSTLTTTPLLPKVVRGGRFTEEFDEPLELHYQRRTSV